MALVLPKPLAVEAPPSPSPAFRTAPDRGVVWRWLLGLSVFTLASFARWAGTGGLRVDENYPKELLGSALYVAMLAGWALAVTSWVRLLNSPPQAPRWLIYAGLAVTAPMLPLLSNDLYGLFAYSGLAAHGKDVYLSTQALSSSPWFYWIGERWRNNLFAYGPLALLTAAWPAVVGEHRPLLAIFLLRLTWLVPVVLAIELSLRLFRDRPFFQAMVWLNPLVLLQGEGQLHLNLLGLAAVVAGMGAQRFGRRGLGALGWAFVTLSKWNLGICAPWFWLSGTRGWAGRWKSAGILAGVLLATALLAYAPVWHGPRTLTAPFQALRAQTLVPGGSVVDVVGEFVDGARRLLSPSAPRLFDPAQPVTARVAEQQRARAPIWRVAQLCMLLVALAAALPLVRLLWQTAPSEEVVALATGTFIVIALTLASPKFQSWYLIGPLPFFGLACPPAWRRWWPWAIFVAVAQEFPQVLPRSAVLFMPAVGASVLLTAVVFLWSFRERYWRGLSSSIPDPRRHVKLDSLSVVLLAYNEEGGIAAAVAGALRAASRVAETLEVVVVGYEGCSDRTNEIVRGLAASDPRIRLVLQRRDEKGYGRAFALGLQSTRHAWIFQTDADGQYDFDDLDKLVARTADPAVALVHGYREVRRDPRERIAMAAAYNVALRLLYRIPLRDVDSAFKLMRGPAARAVTLQARSGFAVAELVIRLRSSGQAIEQLPVRHLPRSTGQALAEKGTANPFGLQLPSPALIAGTLGEMVRMRLALGGSGGRS